jgi:hypothetical protein
MNLFDIYLPIAVLFWIIGNVDLFGEAVVILDTFHLVSTLDLLAYELLHQQYQRFPRRISHLRYVCI